MQLPVIVGLLYALWPGATASGEVENVLVDDDCGEDEGECSVSLRQLRGVLRVAETKEQTEMEAKAIELGEMAKDDEEDLFALADADQDGLVQHEEAVNFLESLGDRSKEDTLAMFQVQDTDSDEGLNGEEFAAALEAWGGGCRSRGVMSYCIAATRHCCCLLDAIYESCGCHGQVDTCGGGHHSALAEIAEAKDSDADGNPRVSGVDERRASTTEEGELKEGEGEEREEDLLSLAETDRDGDSYYPYGGGGGAYHYHGPYGSAGGVYHHGPYGGGSAYHHHGPYGGGGGSYHYHGPYGSGGGGAYHGPYGGGGTYHYHHGYR